MNISRFLLVLAAALLLIGAVVHAAAFHKALPIVDASGLPHFYGGSFKGLWLADSATMLILAGMLIVTSAQLHTATRSLLILIALIPLTTAILLYTFIGSFFAGHLLLVIALLVVVAGFRLPRPAAR